MLRNKSTSIERYKGQPIKANDITPRQKASVFPKVMFILFFGVLFYALGSAQYSRMTQSSAEISAAPDATYLERIDANPIAISTPEVSDWVLGQDRRVSTDASINALDVELKQIEVERQEIQNRQAALSAESEYLEDSALVIQTQQYASLQNQLAELDIRRGETQRKIDEAKGLAEAKGIELQAEAQAADLAEKARIENIELEAIASHQAALLEAETNATLAKAKRELALANIYASVMPLMSVFLLVLSCLLIVLLLSPHAVRVINRSKREWQEPAPLTSQTRDEVDEFLESAATRASEAPQGESNRDTPQAPSVRPKTDRIPQNSKNSSENSVKYVTTNHPWTKKVFNKSQLEIIAGGLGASRPAGIVWAVAEMEISQKFNKVKRQEIRAALRLNGNAYTPFFEEVENCKEKIVNSRGGVKTTTTF